MQTTHVKKLMLLLFIASLNVLPAMGNGFEFVKKSGTINLYERWIEGKDGESVRELKAIFLTNSQSKEIIELLKNAGLGPKWNERTAIYKILKGNSPDTWINYIRYDLPAVMDDQDCCLKYQVHHKVNGRVEINFRETNHPSFPVTEDISRISGVKGSWTLIPQTGNKLQVTYKITSDRNKNIPRFVSDPIIQNNLLKTMNNFKALLES